VLALEDQVLGFESQVLIKITGKKLTIDGLVPVDNMSSKSTEDTK